MPAWNTPSRVPIEVGEVDEVAQQATEVALHAHELRDLADLRVLARQRGVGGDQRGERFAVPRARRAR